MAESNKKAYFMDARTDLISIEKKEFSAYIEKPSSGYDRERKKKT